MLTLTDLYNLKDECVKELNAIGINPLPVKSIELNSRTTTFASCVLYTRKTPCELKFSKYYMYADPIFVKGTMLHELLHAVPEAVHDHHGRIWKGLARKVSDAYPTFEIVRCGSQVRGRTVCLKDLAEQCGKKPRTTKAKRIRVVCADCGEVFHVTPRWMARHGEYLTAGNCTCPKCKGHTFNVEG